MGVLLDNLGHGRRLFTKGKHNALHGSEGIIDRVKNTSLRHTLNQSKSGADRIHGGEGMETPRNYQAKGVGGGGTTPNCLGIALSAGMRSCGMKRVQVHSQGPVKGIYT
jgi:hypothetical protein